MELEALYSKLYDKYTKLKKKKWSELDKLNKNQELKFVNYVNAAEELIQHLKSENDKLRAQVDDLRSEVTSIRSTKDEQFAEYQKCLMEESQKNKALSEEVEKLCGPQREGILAISRDGGNDDGQLKTPRGLRIKMMPCNKNQQENLLKETVPSDALVNAQQPECCRRTINTSDGGMNESGSANCLFQAFVEYLVGMKLTAVTRTEGMSISALHQSSGYSFSLTWVDKAAGEEAELLYRVLSLGTFERVAPEWMREVILFSTSMCPTFFERVSRVIRLRH
uniref:DUF7806 domain-containing protein n=1 Tax=Fagus sylvatica TaxID=28930 RepID=A0A2N9J8V6_FAGSY